MEWFQAYRVIIMTKVLNNAIRGSSGTADSIQIHASDQSVTFPGNVTCSGTATGFGGGQILQVVAEEEANSITNPSGYTTFFDLAITPVSASSKFIVHVSSFYMLNDGREILIRCRDSSSTYVGGIREFKNASGGDIKGSFNTTWFMDQSYSTGSATTFIVEVDDNGNTTSIGSGTSTWKSTMVVYEVGTVNDG